MYSAVMKNPMTPSWIRAFLWFSSKILSISDSMIEAVYRNIFQILEVNMYSNEIFVKFLELE